MGGDATAGGTAGADATAPFAQFVIVRHGESASNAAGTFAGWRDVELTDRGRRQAESAAGLLLRAGVRVDVVFTSMLRRATETADLLLAALGGGDRPRHARWRLNERHCGIMQGRHKDDLKREYGSELARTWRRSWDQRPPAVAAGGPDDPRTDPRYRDADGELPRAEAMGDVAARVGRVWTDEIAPLLRTGTSVLVVGHGMALRALARPLEGITGAELPAWKLASAVPRRYCLDAAMHPFLVEDLGSMADAPDE